MQAIAKMDLDLSSLVLIYLDLFYERLRQRPPETARKEPERRQRGAREAPERRQRGLNNNFFKIRKLFWNS